MKPGAFFTSIVEPTLQWLSPLVGIVPTDEARVLLMTIAGTESNWTERLQIGGPARGRWQFEGGPMSGLAQVILTCPQYINAVCRDLEIPSTNGATLFEALAWNDTLACALARLLLWQHPPKLPELGDVQGAYNYYINTWHPGAPRPDEWPGLYNQAMLVIGGARSMDQGKLPL